MQEASNYDGSEQARVKGPSHADYGIDKVSEHHHKRYNHHNVHVPIKLALHSPPSPIPSTKEEITFPRALKDRFIFVAYFKPSPVTPVLLDL